MVHRNTYVNGADGAARDVADARARPTCSSPGQMSGVEGYVESAASGLIAGLNAAALALGEPPSAPPRTTAIGALALLRVARGSGALRAVEHHVRHHAAARTAASKSKQDRKHGDLRAGARRICRRG